MTEYMPPYLTSESAIQAEIVKRLRASGWLVIVTSQDRRTRKQLKDIPDLICFRRGMTLLVECKTPTGKMKPGQIDFMSDLTEHIGPNLAYQVMRYPDDVNRWCRATGPA